MQWAELEKLVAVGESETVEFKKSTAQPTSRPQNPYITNAFYRRGLIEQWGRGTNRILELSVKAGNPEPEFEETAGWVVVRFRPVAGKTIGEVTGEVGTKSGLSRDQVAILSKCLEECSLKDIMTLAGRSNRTKFRDQFVKPLLEAGLLEMTVPDKPKSRLQKYRLTDKGRAWLATQSRPPGDGGLKATK
ncbi:MAG: ATP-binding protein [Verrucomicrobiota bacterium]